jgi:hypothetical protein
VRSPAARSGARMARGVLKTTTRQVLKRLITSTARLYAQLYEHSHPEGKSCSDRRSGACFQ